MRSGVFEEAYSQRQWLGASYQDRTMSTGGRAGSAPATLIFASKKNREGGSGGPVSSASLFPDSSKKPRRTAKPATGASIHH